MTTELWVVAALIFIVALVVHVALLRWAEREGRSQNRYVHISAVVEPDGDRLRVRYYLDQPYAVADDAPLTARLHVRTDHLD